MRKFLNDYGTVFILLALCLLLSWRTLVPQNPMGEEAGRMVAEKVASGSPPPDRVIIAIRNNAQERQFASAAEAIFRERGIEIVGTAVGAPGEVRKLAKTAEAEEKTIGAVVCSEPSSTWAIFDNIGDKLPNMKGAAIVKPETYLWPTFLKKDNLINISNQIVVIATIAIGMTLVIITGGIELSVGSMIAFSSCLAAWFIKNWGGAEEAGNVALVLCCLLAVAISGCVGLFSATFVTVAGIQPFIVTLSTMMVASGLAFMISGGYSIYQLPWSLTWLGRSSLPGGIPVSVGIMLILYVCAHLLMSRTILGRYIYAVGGGREAARLSGVPVKFVLFFVYVATAVLAGFGGIITASQMKAGAPTYGVSYEMYVIAAVVVGGTSLTGGEGKIFGTLIGSFIIAVIQNGMNLLAIESYTQKVILGLVILGAVLLDRLKRLEFSLFRNARREAASPEAAQGR